MTDPNLWFKVLEESYNEWRLSDEQSHSSRYKLSKYNEEIYTRVNYKYHVICVIRLPFYIQTINYFFRSIIIANHDKGDIYQSFMNLIPSYCFSILNSLLFIFENNKSAFLNYLRFNKTLQKKANIMKTQFYLWKNYDLNVT